jgi:diketogulonate reductase-like aldo/keto reductase
MEDDTIKKIAREKGVDVAQILISWGLRKGWGVLPKSSDARRITRNFQVVELSVGEMKTLDEIEEGKDEGRRFVNPVEIFGFDFFVGDVV